MNDAPVHESYTLQGVALSPGLAIGPAHVVWRGMPDTPEYCITPEHQAEERERFLAALQSARAELGRVQARLEGEGGHAELLYLLDAHRMILEDGMLRDGVMQHLALGYNAEWAVKQHLATLMAAFDDLEAGYLREKRHDIAQVGRLLLNTLLGLGGETAHHFPHPVILVGESFSPADTLLMKRDTVLGFVSEVGGRTSHTAILARSLGIPAVAGVAGAAQRVGAGDTLVVDGLTGQVHVNPAPTRLVELTRRRGRFRAFQKALAIQAHGAAQTVDGRQVRLYANVNFLEDARRAWRLEAEGVGLYRTEHLYLNRRTRPGEESVLRACLRVLEVMPGKPVTLRTLDVGGEKGAALMCAERSGGRRHPPPGLRAIRFCLQEAKGTFLTQLRAFLRASAHGPVRILFPMISSVEELREAQAMLAEARAGLVAQRIPVAERVPVGIMVEVPAAALCADELAGLCDFFSIGTNDLVQYTLAADRVEESLDYPIGCSHPAVLRLIKMTIAAAHAHAIPVGVCGEMASDPRFALLLTGLAVDELSVSPRSLPMIRRVIQGVSMAQAAEAAQAGSGPILVEHLDRLLTAQLGQGYQFM